MQRSRPPGQHSLQRKALHAAHVLQYEDSTKGATLQHRRNGPTQASGAQDHYLASQVCKYLGIQLLTGRKRKQENGCRLANYSGALVQAE